MDLKIEVDPTSLQGLHRLADNALLFPGRVERAKTVATKKAIQKIKAKAVRRRIPGSHHFNDDAVIPMRERHTSKTSSIIISFPRADASGGEIRGAKNKARMSVRIALTGRRKYSSRKKNGVYRLRANNRKNYPPFLSSWTVPSKAPNEPFVRFWTETAPKIFRDEIRGELNNVGFGSRGGRTGIRGDF